MPLHKNALARYALVRTANSCTKMPLPVRPLFWNAYKHDRACNGPLGSKYLSWSLLDVGINEQKNSPPFLFILSIMILFFLPCLWALFLLI